MSKKKVLILFTSSELGGAEKSLTRLASTIKNRIDIYLATMDGKGPWIKFCNQNNITPITLGRRKEKLKHGSINFENLFKLTLLLYKEKYDIVYGVGMRISFILRFLTLFSNKTKFINAVRWHPASSKIEDKFFRVMEKHFSFLVDFYICNSEISKSLLIEKCKVKEQKINVIYNGIQNNNFLLKNNNKVPILLITANLSPRKGIDKFLIQVIKPLLNKGIRFHLYIAGRDEVEGKIDRIIVENNLNKVVTLLGFVDKVEKYFKLCDIFVLPSTEREGCPTSILEAMSFAKPTIAFNIDGIPELIQNGEHGFLIKTFSYKIFQEHIILLLNNKKLREKMGRAALLRQKKFFNVDKFASQHIECFEKLNS